MELARYEQAFEHRVAAWVTLRGQRHDGVGTLKWSPDAGVELRILLDAGLHLTTHELTTPLLVQGLMSYGDRFEVTLTTFSAVGLSMGELHGTADELVKERDFAFGEDRSAVYAFVDFGTVSDLPLLPDSTERSLSVAGVRHQSIRSGFGGLHVDDGRDSIIAYRLEDSRYLLATGRFTLEHALPWVWQWAVNWGDATSWFAGVDARTVFVEAYVGGKLRFFFRRRREVRSLRDFLVGHDVRIIQREQLLPVLNFYATPSEGLEKAKRLFAHLVDASSQRSGAGRDLLLATALEGLLRSHFDMPFVGTRRRDSFNADGHLNLFVRELFDEQAFRLTRIAVGEAFKKLRDRAAHPDWSAAATSGPHVEEARFDREVLAKFYKAVVLAYARAPNEPIVLEKMTV